MLFLETGAPAKSLSTKAVILSTCSCRNLNAALGFPDQISRCTFHWHNVEFTRFTQSLGQMLLGRDMKVSYTQFCCVLHLLSSKSDLFYLLHTNLSCSFSRGVLAVLVFALMMSGACLKSGSMSLSNRVCPSSQHTIKQQKTFHV